MSLYYEFDLVFDRPNSDASNGKPHMVGGHTSIGGNGGPPTMVGGEKEKNKKTCEEGMSMVKNYLETSKIELIQNIKAAKSKQCSLQGKIQALASCYGIFYLLMCS